MPTFNAPFSSSPAPSTPDPKFRPPKGRSVFTDMPEHPSTTPAGPPPQSNASHTPFGVPPPSSYLGSSQPGFRSPISKLNLKKQQPAQGDYSLFAGGLSQPVKNTRAPGGATALNRFSVPEASSSVESDDEDLPQDLGLHESHKSRHSAQQFDESMVMGESAGTFNETAARNPNPLLGMSRGNVHPRSSMLGSSFGPSARQSALRPPKPMRQTAGVANQLPTKGDAEIIPKIAQRMASSAPAVELTESDALIMDTENIMESLDDSVRELEDEEAIQRLLATHTLDLALCWLRYAHPSHSVGEIGPGPEADRLQTGTYLGGLLLGLHHPPILAPTFQEAGPMALGAPAEAISVPKVLLDWLNRYHVSYHSQFRDMKTTKPDMTAHEQFWDLSYVLLLRGEISQLVQLFTDANFQYALSALDDGRDEPGYHGAQLQAVQSAVFRARELLRSCPASQNDWYTDSSDWELFRLRVKTELDHLADYEADDDDDYEAETGGAFRLPKTKALLPRVPKRKQQRLPLGIYEKLKILYLIMLGSAEEIVAASQDWLEATVALTVWWDGAQDISISSWSANVSRAQHTVPQLADDPYLARLSAAFLHVTDPKGDSCLPLNTLRPVEVAVASILQGNVQGALGLIRTFSLTMAAAIAEVACIGGWLGSEPEDEGLDREDLLVLGFGKKSSLITQDDLLIAYSEQLFAREELQEEHESRDGWDIAITVASRIMDHQLADTTIDGYLESVSFDSQEGLDRLFSLCSNLSIEDKARKVAERFADHLASTTNHYGPALTCYARAHAPTKIRQLVDLLVSYSLVQSAAYPAPTDMDDTLRSITESPKRAFSKLRSVDPEAAAILQYYITGYACLRRFYQLRDQDITPRPTNQATMNSESERPKERRLMPYARNKEALRALIATINSAADTIYGGLYDPERDSAIQVEALLTLLGELTIFFAPTSSQEDDFPSLSATQLQEVLAAIEDLETIKLKNARIAAASEEGMKATLSQFRGVEKPDLREMFKKSVSGSGKDKGKAKATTEASETGSSFSFSLLGSEMLERSVGPTSASAGFAGRSGMSSGVLVGREGEDVKRAWDWRERFAGSRREEVATTAKDVLGFLRREIVGALAMAELEAL